MPSGDDEPEIARRWFLKFSACEWPNTRGEGPPCGGPSSTLLLNYWGICGVHIVKVQSFLACGDGLRVASGRPTQKLTSPATSREDMRYAESRCSERISPGAKYIVIYWSGRERSFQSITLIEPVEQLAEHGRAPSERPLNLITAFQSGGAGECRADRQEGRRVRRARQELGQRQVPIGRSAGHLPAQCACGQSAQNQDRPVE